MTMYKKGSTDAGSSKARRFADRIADYLEYEVE